MSIDSTVSRNDYVGNGATDTYSYTFKIFSDSDLTVTVRDTDDVEAELVLTTDYTVTGAGSSSGGTIVLVDGNLTSGDVLTIRRVREITQEFDIKNQGDFYAETHEDAFDTFIMIDQQQQDVLDRAVALPVSVASSAFDTTLPISILDAANQVLIVNAGSDGFDLGPALGSFEASEAAAAASASSASSSASAAASSASGAATSATSASSSASAASSSASAASSSASSASSSATNAATSAAAAASSASDLASGTITTVRLGDGLSDTPSLTFASDANSGLYRVASDDIVLVAGGNTGGTVRVNATGVDLGNSASQVVRVQGSTFRVGSLTASAGANLLSTVSATANQTMTVTANSAPGTGADITLYGSSHASKASNVEIITGGTAKIIVDSTGQSKIRNGVIALTVGADDAATTLTDATGKRGRIGVPHYTNAEEPIGLAAVQALTSQTIVGIGGGYSGFNAATDVRLYTAADTTTVTGTARLSIDSTGLVAIAGNATVGGTLAVTGATTLATSLSGVVKTVSGVVSAASLVNADVSASAAIAYSKLSLTGSILNADVSASAAIAGSKIAPDFGAQNVVTTGSMTGASHIPSASTVPTNGMYLPSANTVAFATNSTLAGQFTSSGAFQAKGSATNDSASAGYMGEYIESVVSTLTNVAATTVWGNCTSISLTAGDWDVTGIVDFDNTTQGASISGNMTIAISKNSGTTTTDHVIGSNQVNTATAGAASARSTAIPSYRISLSSTTTVYLKELLTFTTATPQFRCRLSARRMR